MAADDRPVPGLLFVNLDPGQVFRHAQLKGRVSIFGRVHVVPAVRTDYRRFDFLHEVAGVSDQIM